MLNRILAIDYGDKKVGLALSDPMKIIAKPYKTITNDSKESLLNDIIQIIQLKDVNEIVVGLPKTLKNTYSEQTYKVKDFIDYITVSLDINVVIVDERLSSIEAKRSLIAQGIKTGHNKKDVDMTAAALFLQNYLDKIEK
ncbi:MAG: Holliday junction resolvase RuvX [Candidatus Marinimicrobia bacterium]|nr:Holliday junction resolvase RuvX [Candidatus Neomarinimicrobiota bacterium]